MIRGRPVISPQGPDRASAASIATMIGQSPDAGPMIDMRGIFKSFGTLRVLNDVSVRVDRGQVVVVIGPSGSGKSTLLRCINRLETEIGRAHV